MPSSNVLVVGSPNPRGPDFGADFVPSFAAARAYLIAHRPAVLVFGATNEPADFNEFCVYAANHVPDALWVLASEGLAAPALIHWNNQGRVHDLVDTLSDADLETKTRAAIEARDERSQKSQLVALFEDQSARLTRLSAELETRVQKRHKALRKSLRTLEVTKARMQVFHEALIKIHRASTVLQMEQALNEALRGTVNVAWVRVRFFNQSVLKTRAPAHVLAVDLPHVTDRGHGEVLFAKTEGERFTSDEQEFLQEISEALALALARLQKLEQAETLKGQWQATFDAIPHALVLVTHDFEILKLNAAFQHASHAGGYRDLLGKNCFHAFFGKDFRPPIRLESPFSFRHARTRDRGTEHFEITGQRLGLAHEQQNVQLLLLRNITQEVRFERRILEGAKLAELGTIGSSIAHELNNPLGGMLSFLQLILMDLPKTDALYPEVKAMEAAALRCRDIVQNLLSFARKHDLGEMVQVDFWEIIERAVRLTELQTKSLGIALEMHGVRPAPIMASPNALAQAICNLLQNALDAIAEKGTAEGPGFSGRIRLELEHDGRMFQLRISDNGTGIKPEVETQIFNPLFTTRDPERFGGMGLTTAYTIVSEHNGRLEILSRLQSGTAAILSLPRLDQSPD